MNSMDRKSAFFRPGGTLEPGAACYIVRKADEQLLDALLDRNYVFLLDSRQKGKSSLVARCIVKLKEAGVQPVKLDLQRIGANVSPEQWYAGLVVGIGQELGLQSEVLSYWHERQSIGPLARFVGAIQEVVLSRRTEPIVIFIDEVDFVRALDFTTDEFFAGIRECYNRRSSDDSFKRLTFCLVGVATPGQLIRNPDISPFNIGEQIELTDFTLEETAGYAKSLNGSSRDGARLIERVHYWVGGHPYLTQLLCSRLAASPQTVSPSQVDELVREVFLSPEARQREPNLADVERRMLEPDVAGMTREERRTQVLDLYGRMLKSKRVDATEQNPVVATLRLSGVGLEDHGTLGVRNRVYRTVFDEKWRQQNLPHAEVRRQRGAARRAVVKATAVASVVILALAAGAIGVWRLSEERQLAIDELKTKSAELSRQSYIGLMADVRLSMAEGRWTRAAALIKKSESDSLRGWEWGHAAMFVNRQVANPAIPASPMALEPQPDGTLDLVTTNGIYDVSPKGVQKRAELTDSGLTPLFRRANSRVGRQSLTGELVVQDASTGKTIASNKARHRLFDVDPESGTMLGALPGGNDAPFELLSLQDAKSVGSFRGPTFAIAARFLPDGTILSVHQGGNLRRRDRSGNILASAKTIDVEMRGWGDIALSRDGSQFTFYDSRYRNLEIRRSSDLGTLAVLAGPMIRAKVCSFSHDGTKIAIGDWDGTLNIFSTASGAILNTFVGHLLPLSELEFFNGDRHLASVDNGAKLKIWRVDAPPVVEVFKEHEGQADSAFLVNQGESLVSTSAAWMGEQLMKSRNLRTGKVSVRSKWRSAVVAENAVYTTDAKGNVSRLNVNSLQPERSSKVFDENIGELRLFARGSRLLVQRFRGENGRPSNYAILDSSTLVELARFQLPWVPGTLLQDLVSFDASGDHILIAAHERDPQTMSVDLQGLVYIVSGKDGKILKQLRTKQPFSGAVLNPAGTQIVLGMFETGKFRTRATIFAVSTLKEVAKLPEVAKVDTFLFDPSGRYLAGYKANGLGFLWDAEKRNLFPTLNPGGGIQTMEFSPDGRRLITGASNRTTTIWDAHNGDELFTLRYESLRKGDLNGDTISDRSTFSEDGRKVIMACTDGAVRIWNSVPWK